MNERQRRIDQLLFWRRIGVAAALDGTLAIGLAWFFRSDYEPFSWITALAIFAVLWAIEIVMGLKKALWGFASLLIEPKLLTANFLEILRATKLPPPSRDWPPTMDYLASLADDESRSAEDRVKAAGLFSAWTAIIRVRGLTAGMVIQSAFDAAIRQYDAEITRRHG